MVIAIFSIIIAFFFYYNDKTPKLSIAKIGEINVLEINRNLDELQIFYNDVDIKNKALPAIWWKGKGLNFPNERGQRF